LAITSFAEKKRAIACLRNNSKLDLFGYVDKKWLGAQNFISRRIRILKSVATVSNHIRNIGFPPLLSNKPLISNRISWIPFSAYLFSYPAELSVLSFARELGVACRLIVDDPGDSLEWSAPRQAVRTVAFMRRADKLIVQTHAYKRLIINRFSFKPDNIEVVPHSSPEYLFESPPDWQVMEWKGDSKLIAHGGRMTGEQYELYRLILGKNQNYKLLLIGTGTEDLSETFQDTVRAIPAVHGKRFASLLRACDCAIVSYPSNFKVLPMKLIDYLAIGLPVFANEFDAIRDYLPTNAYIKIDASISSLSYQKIIDQLSTLELDEIGRRGKDFAKRNFSEAVIKSQMKRVLNT
jgi:glycosyltransferase involved in cell wall biosynthesis